MKARNTCEVLKDAGLVGVDNNSKPYFKTQQWDAITHNIPDFGWVKNYGRKKILHFWHWIQRREALHGKPVQGKAGTMQVQYYLSAAARRIQQKIESIHGFPHVK
eukprot:scaffold682187_cov157-Attheya_sp.AAC.1